MPRTWGPDDAGGAFLSDVMELAEPRALAAETLRVIGELVQIAVGEPVV